MGYAVQPICPDVYHPAIHHACRVGDASIQRRQEEAEDNGGALANITLK